MRLRRPVRKSMAIVLDLVLCVVAVWLAQYLRTGAWDLFSRQILIVCVFASLAWLLIAMRLSIYKSVIRFSGGRTVLALAAGCGALAVVLAVFLFAWYVPQVPRTVAILQPLVLFNLLALSRMLISLLLVDLLHMAKAEAPPRRVLIYGAGLAGTLLAGSLRRERDISVVGFVDDDRRLDMQRIDGLTVWHSARLAEVIGRQLVDEVLLAIPSASRARRREIVAELRTASIRVRSLPSVTSIIDGQVSVSDLRDVQVDELLGRDPVAPNEILMGRTLTGKRVLVTGAGGSIGSELCRQIMLCNPTELILVDQSELGLYSIEAELREALAKSGRPIQLFAELCDVADQGMASRLMARWRPETVFHAAAYKHVPLVEANPIAGIRNNVQGTLNCALAAQAAGTRAFILISTDKAVRPTNVMGASKRVCELILQALAGEKSGTLFTMVRFGNVLGSSGSVVPRFKAQIAAGGPVTITDTRITRYFMTIPEAAQLVIQAGGMAKGGDVFVLDMGQPIRILDMATAMISLSGLSVRNADNPDGDIEIVEVGLRDGEKLYEELLIGNNPEQTMHERIMRAQEHMIPWSILSASLDRMKQLAAAGDAASLVQILRELVPEFQPETGQKSPPITAEAR